MYVHTCNYACVPECVCNLGIVKAGQVTNLISSGVCPVVFFIHRNLCEGHESEKETWFGDRKRTAIVIWAWIESADRHSDRTMVINSLLTNCGGFTFWLRFLLGTARTLRCYRHAGFHQGLHHPHITLYIYHIIEMIVYIDTRSIGPWMRVSTACAPLVTLLIICLCSDLRAG